MGGPLDTLTWQWTLRNFCVGEVTEVDKVAMLAAVMLTIVAMTLDARFATLGD